RPIGTLLVQRLRGHAAAHVEHSRALGRHGAVTLRQVLLSVVDVRRGLEVGELRAPVVANHGEGGCVSGTLVQRDTHRFQPDTGKAVDSAGLRLEVAKEGARRNIGGSGDVLDGDLVEATLAVEPDRRVAVAASRASPFT